jgi:hypothetical protein
MSYVRVSDEKDARWSEIQHRNRMNRLREEAEKIRIARMLKTIDRCPHCGHHLDTKPMPSR